MKKKIDTLLWLCFDFIKFKSYKKECKKKYNDKYNKKCQKWYKKRIIYKVNITIYIVKLEKLIRKAILIPITSLCLSGCLNQDSPKEKPALRDTRGITMHSNANIFLDEVGEVKTDRTNDVSFGNNYYETLMKTTKDSYMGGKLNVVLYDSKNKRTDITIPVTNWVFSIPKPTDASFFTVIDFKDNVYKINLNANKDYIPNEVYHGFIEKDVLGYKLNPSVKVLKIIKAVTSPSKEVCYEREDVYKTGEDISGDKILNRYDSCEYKDKNL